MRAMQITYRDKKWELKGNITARDAIKKTGLDPESVLVVVNGKLVTDDVVLRADDQVKLVAVVSGGAGDQGSGGAKEKLSLARLLFCAPALV
jgi:sulfur carrier protein ThiS